MNSLPTAIWSTKWGGVDIAVFTTGNDSPLTVAAAAVMLNDEEKARGARFHFSGDRERWIRSRALLRLSLAEKMEVEADGIVFRTGSHGKPELHETTAGSKPAGRAARMAAPHHFNLSHSGDYVAVAISVEQVGVDLEQWKERLPVADLAAHAFRPEEAAAIAGSTEPHLLFYRLWTAKEAVMKCTGLGLSLPPASIIVRCDANGIPCLARRNAGAESFDIFAHDVPRSWTISAARRTVKE